MRALFNVFAAVLVSLSALSAPFLVSAQEDHHEFNLLLLIDQTYFVREGEQCRIDIDGQSKVLLKVNNQRGRRAGGEWFINGQPIQLTNEGRTDATYCAYAKTVTAEDSGQMDLLLHDVFLTTIDPQTIRGDEMLQLVVGSRGLVDEQFIEYDEVALLPIDVPARLETAPVSTGSTATRSERTRDRPIPDSDNDGDVSRTSRSTSSESSTTSSGNTSETTQQSGIVTGEWELEGDSMWDFFFISIDEDWYGSGPEIIADIDPMEIAVELGSPLIGEGRAPDGCRVFAYSGPMGIALYVAYCANGDHLLYAAGTDKEILDDIVADFTFGRPFSIPWGYTEVY